MTNLSRILFVANGTGSEQSALTRATWLASNFAADQLKVMVLESPGFGFRRKTTRANTDSLEPGAVAGEQQGLQVADSVVVKLKDSTKFEFETGCNLRQVINATGKYDVVIKSAGRIAFPLFQRWSDEDSKLLRHSACPTWIIRNSEHKPGSKILAVVDLTPPDSHIMARMVVSQAVAIAEKSDARVELATTWHIPQEQKLRSPISLAGLRRQLQKSYRQQLKSLKDEFRLPKDATHLIHGDMRVSIPRLVNQQNFDLAVIGELADVKQHIAGNTAERLLAESQSSVLSISAIPNIAAIKDHSPKAKRTIAPRRSCEKLMDDEGVLRY